MKCYIYTLIIEDTSKMYTFTVIGHDLKCISVINVWWTLATDGRRLATSCCCC